MGLIRSKIYNDFNFGERVCKIFDLQEKRSRHLEAISELDQEIANTKSELPDEVITLYEQLLVVDKLKGDKGNDSLCDPT